MLIENEDEKPRNRKLRRNKKNWEKLREKPIVAIDTLSGGGLVSGQISGKALGGRIGRRIGGASKPMDMNPTTARDADMDGMVLEGIPTIRQGRGMPDPTPGGEVAGRMGREQNKEEFVGVDKLLRQHFSQFAKFQEWTKNKDWNAFHRNHFDWWMFPIPLGSNSYRDEYNIAGEPLEELRQNKRYMATLASAMRMYTRSIGWDMDSQEWINNAEIERGQEPVRSLNRARLLKIAQSAEAHGLDNELSSMSHMVNDMRSNGIPTGNDEYWNSISGRMSNPDRPNFPLNPKQGDTFSSDDPEDTRIWKFDGKLWVRQDGGGRRSATVGFRKAGGSGGKSISPSASSIRAGSERTVKYGSPAFDELWERRDKENEQADGTNLTFDWKNEESRLYYLSVFGKFPNTHPKNRKKVGWAKFGGGNEPGNYSGGTHSWIAAVKNQLRELGISLVPQEHPKMGDQYGSWISFSGSPGASAAEGASAKQLLSHLAETISPDTFYEHFEAWIRNPFVTAQKNGKDVGVRLAFNNDKEKLLNEYRRRVIALRDALYSHFGNEVDEVAETMVKPLTDSSGKSSTNTGNDWVDLTENARWASNLIKQQVSNILEQEKPRSEERLAYLLDSRLQSKLPDEIRQQIRTSPSFIRGLLQEEFKNRDWGRGDNFSQIDLMPSVDDETVSLIEELADEFIEKLISENADVSVVSDADSKNFIDSFVQDSSMRTSAAKPMLQSKLSNRIARGQISGKMGNTPENDIEAKDLEYDPDTPEHLGNHFTSKHEGYDVRPNPVDNVLDARNTGAPLEWLVPGSYHPEIKELVNGLTDKVLELGFASYLQTNPDFYMGSKDTAGRDAASEFRGWLGGWIGATVSKIMALGDFGEDFELDDGHRDFIRNFVGDMADTMTRFSDIPREDPDGRGGNTMQVLRGLISRVPGFGSGGSMTSDLSQEVNDIASGLAMRAIHAGLKINNMQRMGISDRRRANQDTLDWWNSAIGAGLLSTSPSDYESIDDIGYENLMKESQVSVAMPINAVLNMFADNEFKTLFETNTSQGNVNTSARAAAEFAMFGILPSYKGKRPAYGILHVGGMTEDAIKNTNQYGPIRIVLNPDMNEKVTWTEIDSLSLMSTASTLKNPSQHGLFGQRLTSDTPFTRVSAADIISLIERGRDVSNSADDKSAIGRSKYAEAQIHSKITLEDIQYIVVDDTDFRWGDIDFPPFGPDGMILMQDDDGYEEAADEFPDDIMDYEGFIQISKIAESLNIPVVLLSDITNAGEEVVRP